MFYLKNARFIRAGVILLPFLILLGCAANAAPAPTPRAENATSAPAQTARATQPLLLWQGHTPFGTDGDDTRCKTLAFDSDAQQASVGYCDSTLKTDSARGMGEWMEKMRAQFAPFTYETAQDKLVWRGQGAVQGEAWQRALVEWNKLKYGELESGRACASCGTVISWWLPNQDAGAMCRHVYVVQIGYAYANTEPCHNQSAPPASQAEGWLTTAEMTQLDVWLYSSASFAQGDSYLDGKGAHTFGATEAKQIDAWAQQVFERLQK